MTKYIKKEEVMIAIQRMMDDAEMTPAEKVSTLEFIKYEIMDEVKIKNEEI